MANDVLVDAYVFLVAIETALVSIAITCSASDIIFFVVYCVCHEEYAILLHYHLRESCHAAWRKETEIYAGTS